MKRGGRADIGVEITLACRELTVDLQRLEGLARAVCAGFGKNAAQVGIAIVDDAAIIRANEQFLGKKQVTDVISFDLSEDKLASFELLINGEEAERQARERGHSVEAELALYIMHGLLHQLGFDDVGPGDADRMHAAEDAILQEAGFGSVYSRSAGDKCAGGGPAPGNQS